MTIRALAKAATPGPWHEDGRLILDKRGDAIAMVNLARMDSVARADAAYIAFMTPERAVAMQDVIDAAKAIRPGLILAPDDDLFDEFDAALARLEGIR